MRAIFLIAASALAACPAWADPMIQFSASGILFRPSGSPPGSFPGFSTGAGAQMTVTGVSTPQNSGVTVNGCCAGGFNWNAPVTSSSANSWSFAGTDIIIEAGFDFSGGIGHLQPGDIGTFMYEYIGGTSPFTMSQTGALTFSTQGEIAIDPRVAAFYGLGAPCLVDPMQQIPYGACGTNSITPLFGVFSGQGTPIPGQAGAYSFDVTLDVIATPEPASLSLLCIVALLLSTRFVKRRPDHS